MQRLTPIGLVDAMKQGCVLDVRDAASFGAGHLPGSGHVPADTFAARRAELPPRDSTIIVAAETTAAAEAAAHELEALGYTHIHWLDASVASLEVACDRSPAAPLWKPAAFLEERLASIPRGRALDLAAGSGRDAVYLALHGFEVEAWDWDADALASADEMAARHGVTLQTRVCDLESDGLVWPEARYQLITCFRYLHRPLFPTIERALAPDGHLLFETYREGQERHGRPRRARFLLKTGELRSAFPHLETLFEQELDPPEGAVVARLHARRRP